MRQIPARELQHVLGFEVGQVARSFRQDMQVFSGETRVWGGAGQGGGRV